MSAAKLFFKIIIAARVSPFCKVAGNSALIDRGTEVAIFMGDAMPRPKVGWMAKAPIVRSDGAAGVHRSLVPLPSLLEEKKERHE